MSVVSDQLRDQIAARAGHCSEYCHLPAPGQVARFPIDHVIPRSQGGQTQLANLAFACPNCNAHKWAVVDGIDPLTGVAAPLFNPRIQVCSDHFEWSASNLLELQGKTPIGRATVSRLQMNHPDMLAVRRLLLALGIQIGPS